MARLHNTGLPRRAAWRAGLALWLVLAGTTQAQTPSSALSPREAHDAVATGRLLLIDIRTSAEWADTGLPPGATPLDAEASGFEVRLAGLRLDNPGKRIALIDRSGALATAVRQKLAGRGWRDLATVRGGMLGPGGWLAEKLPVTRYP